MKRRNLLALAALPLLPREPLYERETTWNIEGVSGGKKELMSESQLQELLSESGIDIRTGGSMHYQCGGIGITIEHWPEDYVWDALQGVYRLRTGIQHRLLAIEV